jgi:hypothetical protein
MEKERKLARTSATTTEAKLTSAAAPNSHLAM